MSSPSWAQQNAGDIFAMDEEVSSSSRSLLEEEEIEYLIGLVVSSLSLV
jgi:hypothetical protein